MRCFEASFLKINQKHKSYNTLKRIHVFYKMALDDFFASSYEEIIALIVYQTVFFFSFYGSYRPIWAQNEITKLNVDRKTETVKLGTVRYGWQTRKRNEWNARHYARWVTMNPEYFYNGLLWTVFFYCAGYGAYYTLIDASRGDLRTVALTLTTLQAFFIGIWTIPGFYWDLPFWSIAILGLSSALSIAVTVLYGVLECYTGMWFFMFYTAGQIILFSIYAIAYGLSIYEGQWINQGLKVERARKRGRHHSRPLGLLESFWVYGLYPGSYMERDLPWVLRGVYREDPPLA